MQLVTDKLQKSELKYDLLDEEKRDLSKDERLEFVPAQHHASRLIYILLVGLALTAAAWLMFATTSTTFSAYELDTKLMASTYKALNETEVVLSKVQDSVKLIRDDNTQLAVTYVEAIKEMLQERTRYAVNQINRIVNDKIREIENELTSFDYVITEASAGIVDYTLQDMKNLRDSIPSITNETYRADLENVFEKVDKQIASAFSDLDEMYTFYGSYMGDIIDHKVQNATDRISLIVNSNRRQCECTIKEKINFCYTISSQNVKISQQLESLVKVFGIVNNTTDILDTLEPVMLKNTDQHTCNLISEARLTLNKALEKGEALLESILKDDNCYLGSAVRKTAYQNHGAVKEYVKNNFEVAIRSLSTDLNRTTADFQVVKESHRKQVEEDLAKGLEALTHEILMKTKRLGKEPYEEYLTKASFPDTKSWMDMKFQNVTQVINPMFAKKQADIAEALKYNLQYVVFQQVPFISSLSIQNYMPTDVCPLSTDYQKFVSVTLDGYLDPTDNKTQKELAMSADFAKESETTQLIEDEENDAATDSNQTNVGTQTDSRIMVNDQSSPMATQTDSRIMVGDQNNPDDDAIVAEVKKIIQKYAGDNGMSIEPSEIQVMVIPVSDDGDQVEGDTQIQPDQIPERK
ncbi:uncharacterized protein LOC135844769 [Planococcus citri]|uniref:uncharacterized protein LOC135844769 n=1 Tax=Planococcus citri TaxID=170843 RepID=UPI0031F793C8